MKSIYVDIKHSESKSAWNIIGTMPGGKYKIARIPYLVIQDNEILTTLNKKEALDHALFIRKAFNTDYEKTYGGT